MNITNKPKVALVCDWLTGIGGAERVLLELHRLYPEAPIYTSQYDSKGIDWFKDADVRTGWLQKLPTSIKKFLPILRAFYFSNLNLDEYDLVISASGAEAKGIKTGKDTVHIDYCHSPTHYYWSRYDDYLKNPGFEKLDWLARIGLKLFVGPMRSWDKKAAQRPDYMIANSTHTKKMIQKYYGRNSTIIFPPVDIERFKNDNKQTREGFLIIGRQTPYKRIDLAVKACTDLNLELTVIGDGPEHNNLLKIAGSSINFLAKPSDEIVNTYFAKSEAFIFPGIDDFGIVAVEALAAGLPVIAYKGGGALDYIKTGLNGLFFEDQSIDSLKKALVFFKSFNTNTQKISKSADYFSNKVFEDNVKTFIDRTLVNFK